MPLSLKTIRSHNTLEAIPIKPCTMETTCPRTAGIGVMLAPRDDEILLLQIVLSEGQRAAPLSMFNRAAVCVTADAAPGDGPQKVSRIRRACAFDARACA
jgi:hypothetical protein